MSKEITLHKFQKQALFSGKRITAAVAGIQSGKTFSGSLWHRMKISEYTSKDDCTIVCAPTYKLLTSSTLPAFMRLHSDMGTLFKGDMEFRFRHGPIVFIRSMDNEWSCEGITNCRAIWGDEAGLFSTQAWINLMGRAAPKQADIFLSTTPYRLNTFLFRDVYEPWKAGERDDVEVVQFRSIDNPYFPPEEYERQKRLLDPRMFAMRYEGKFERMAGLVYSDLNYENYTDAFQVDLSRYQVFGGIDWGYTDPFAIVVRAISNDGKHDYQIAEYKMSGHTPDEQITITKQFHKVYGIKMFYADCAEPGLIALFQKSGIPIDAVTDKEIEYGIAVHLAIIRSRMHRIFRGKCKETEYEYESYQYKDFDPDNQAAAKPLDLNNHCMDANRYVTTKTMWLRDKAFIPFKATKTHLQQLLAGEFHQVRSTDDDWYDK